jgi:hypothetical protein
VLGPWGISPAPGNRWGCTCIFRSSRDDGREVHGWKGSSEIRWTVALFGDGVEREQDWGGCIICGLRVI